MIRPLILALSLCAGLAPLPGAGTGSGALELPVSARLTAERVSPQDRYDAPVGPFDGERIATVTMEGAVRRQAYQIPGTDLTPLQVLAPLRSALQGQGFDIRLDCVSQQCGGFDFRFNTDVFPAPSMFVALQDFQFLTLSTGPRAAPDAVITLLASATREAAYLQIIEVRRDGEFGPITNTVAPPVAGSVRPSVPDAPDRAPDSAANSAPDGVEDLLALGSVVLNGVDFASGQTELDQPPYPALERLARVMADNPTLRIALVGHTDSVGALDGNIAISRARARAVRSYMIANYDVDPARMEAEGMGYLAPVASNLTPEGREANRRVEAIVLSAR